MACLQLGMGPRTPFTETRSQLSGSFCSGSLRHRGQSRSVVSAATAVTGSPPSASIKGKKVFKQNKTGVVEANELLLLQEENYALRRELAKHQGVPPDQVTFGEQEGDTLVKSAAQEGDMEVAIRAADATNTGVALGAGSDAVPTDRGPSAVPSEIGASATVPEVANESLEAGIAWPSPEENVAWERPARSQPWRGPGRQRRSVKCDANSLHIVHISAEFAPVAKVGGLGDVVTGLARASLERGHTVEVILPFYEFLDDVDIQNLQHIADFDVPKGSHSDGQMHMGSLRTSAFSGTVDGIPMLLIRPDWSCSHLFKGGRVYAGSYNETEAYLYFSRASLEVLRVTNRRPHIVHAHEWQTAAVPMLFWEKYFHSGLDSARVVLTIHNLDSQGECRQDEFAVTGVPGEVFADVDKALDERTIGHNPERLCLMKGGIVYANAVTTVSPTYAAEAVDGGAAGWLKSTFARPDVRAKFRGILNGIDTGLWDPLDDMVLPAPFDHDQLEGKALSKRYLQKALRLEEADRKPIVAVITRLVPQKGIHLIKHAVYRTLEKGGQFVLLGSGHADGDFRGMADGEFRGHQDVKLMIMYSDSLAHLLYAAADVVLVPSLFEPCGLTQLVGMRYGAVPVVRSTGGLADTVKDVNQGEDGNGFTFDGVDDLSLDSALDRALDAYQRDPDWWRQFVVKNMLRDSSWETSAGEYVKLYSELLPW